MFNESEHPRGQPDNKGQFVEKGKNSREEYTQSVNDRIKWAKDNGVDLPINTDGSVDDLELQRLYNELKNHVSFGSDIDRKLKRNEPLNDNEMETVFYKLADIYENPEKNKGDQNLKRILDMKGFSNIPQKFGRDKLISAISTGTIMFRGLNGEDASKFAQQFYDGEIYVGLGLGGNGVYMSKDLIEAKNYTKGSNVTVVAVMPSV